MTKKVTGKEFKDLLEGVLTERTSIKFPKKIAKMSNADFADALDVPEEEVVGTQFKNVSNLDRSPSDTFDSDDMAVAYSKGVGNRDYDTVQKIVDKTGIDSIKDDWKDLGKFTSTDPTEMGDIEDIDIDAQTYEPDSMVFQQMANIGSQNSDPSKPVGMMPEGLAASVKTFFDGTSTFEERLQKISAFSTAVFDEKEIKNMRVTELLAAAIFGDYLNTIVKEMDAGSAAYQFEALLAQMAGGSVTGKGDMDAEGNPISGQMGAVDFVMNDGTFGSAKYYANLNAGSISQSVQGFKNKVGKPILYVIAHKVGDAEAPRSYRGESDPEKITELDIYLVSVTPIVDKPKIGPHFLITTNGLNPHYGYVKGGELKPLAKVATEGVQAIKVKISPNNEKFKDALKTAADNSDKSIKDAFSQFQSLFKNLNKANQKMQRYSSTGDTNAGNDALEGFDEADNEMTKLIELISTGQQVTATGTRSSGAKQREITPKNEQKITSDLLRKLIEESFKK